MSKRNGIILLLALAALFLVLNRAAYKGFFTDDDFDHLSWTRHSPAGEFVVGLISLVWYVMKRIQRSRYPALDERGPSLIDVVTTTSLGPNRSLHLVRVGDEIVLVGSTDHSVNIVARIGGDDAALIEDVAPLSPAFGRSSTAVRGAAMDDRERAVATATEGSLVERLRAMTTRH